MERRIAGWAMAVAATLACAAGGCAGGAGRADTEAAVLAADRDLARAVAERDDAGFRDRIAPDAVFLGRTALRGREAITEGWGPIVRGEVGLSWEPEEVHVAESGDLAYTIGRAEFAAPEGDPAGPRYSTYLTVWRKGEDGVWRAVADGGSQAAPAAGPSSPAPPPEPR